MDNSNSEKGDRSIFGALISNLPTIIQLTVVLSVGLTTSIGLSNFFYFNSQLTLINFLTFLLTTSSIFSFSFFRNNRNIQTDFTNPERNTKTFINILQILQIIFFLIFLIFTLLISSKIGNLLFFGIIQAVAYPILLIVVGLIIFIWFQNYSEKQKYFKVDDLLPNLNISLRRQGILRDKNEIILINDLNNGNKLFKIKMEDNATFYVVTSFDAKLIFQKLTEDEYSKNLKSTI